MRDSRRKKASPKGDLQAFIQTGRPGVPSLSILDNYAPVTHSRIGSIVETRFFTTRILELLTDEQYRALQTELLERPDAGEVIRGTGGLRKLRWASVVVENEAGCG